jgi:membrane protease YdiL (CAAX protease family)
VTLWVMALTARSKLLLRLLTLGVPMFVLYIAAQLAGAAIAGALPAAARPAIVTAYGLLASAVIWLVYRFAARRIERREPREIAAPRAARDTAFGFAIGVGLFTTTEAILVALGYAHVVGYGGFARVAPLFAGATLAAVGEEIIFRGVLVRILRDAFNAPVAIAVSSLLFGGIHALNPDATLAGEIGIALEAGVLLGLAYLWTGSVWLPIGIHLGWNLTGAAIFGNIISGTGGNGPGVVAMTVHGPALWTGGQFGPEASLPAVVVCTIASLVILRVVRRS